MKRTEVLLLGAAAALAAAGCVPDATSIQIQYAMSDQPDSTCDVTMSANQRGGGSVDIGNTSHFYTALKVVNQLSSKDLTAGGETVNPGSRNNFNIQGVKLSYQVNGAEVSIPDQQMGDSGVILAGGSLAMGMDLLTPQVVKALYDGYFGKLSSTIRPTVALSVRVSVVLNGKFASGSSYDTAAFDFPLTVYWSPRVMSPLSTDANPVGCTGVWHLTVGSGYTAPACSNFGQDGVPYHCACNDCGGACDTGKKCNTTTCACE